MAPDADKHGDERVEKERLYARGAMAQSYAPRGLADLLNLSPEGRVRARKNWQSNSRATRIAFFLILGIQVAATIVLVWGFASSNRTLILGAAGVLVGLLLGTTATSVALGIRQSRRTYRP